ncbi:MAG: tellurite resistance protein TerB [Muribaculaceae bacterium]|nr:tellurite resistance protein TerB [Muribaculaceae bacterium]
MELTGLQLAAILKAGKAMVMADGRTKEEELLVLVIEMKNFNVERDEFKSLLSAADKMDASTMFLALSNLDDEAKKYVSGYLAAIMAADGEIEDTEVKMWQLICSLANFPTMNLEESLKFWTSH